MKTWNQDPGEKLDYKQSITGDTISTATWSVTPSGPTLGTPLTTSTYTIVRASGMTVGTVYTLTVHIVGASGQEYERSAYIRCEQR